MHQQILSLLSLLPFALCLPHAQNEDTTVRATVGDSTACNNSPQLCQKTYDSVTYLGAHDSPFVRDATTDYSTSGNQFYNSTIQLDAGVRLLTAQVHKSNGGLHLCHSNCDLLDAGTLSSWLSEIKSWLDNNPSDVVTVLLVNSDDTSATDLHQEFLSAEITSYTYTPSSSPPARDAWPTLQSLISANQRLVTFIGSMQDYPSSAAPYLLDEFRFIFENPYANTAYSSFTCEPDRPSSVKGNTAAAMSANLLPFMNHFLYDEQLFDIQVPAVDNITTTNSPDANIDGTLGQSGSECSTAYGRPPTFLLVDFFDEGPAIQAVDTLNGVTDPVGRIAVPPRNHNKKQGGRASVTFAGVRNLAQQVKDGKEVTKGAWIWAAGKWSLGGINLSGGDVIG